MEYTLWLFSDTAEALKKAIPENITVVGDEEDNEYGTIYEVKININSAFDVLSIIQCGIRHGMYLMTKKINK